MKRATLIFCAILCMASRHPDRMIRSDIALNASFNRGDGSDRSMYAHTPTLANGAAITAGNRYLSVDGVNDFLSYPDHDSFSMTNGSGQDQPITVMAWVYLSASANAFKTIAAKSGSASTFEWAFYASSNSGAFKGPALSLFNADSSKNIYAAVNANAIPATTWTHVAAVYTGSETATGIEVYINGVASADVRFADAGYVGTANTSAKLTVGCREISGFYLGGSIDDVRIYNRALSANEVMAIYSEGHP